MNYSADFLYLIVAVSFSVFILSAGLAMRGRVAIKRKLKEEQFEQYDELFGKKLDDSSIKDGLNLVGFYIFRKWDGLSAGARKLLERQRRIGILATVSYVVAKVCFLSALFIDGKIP